MVGSERLYDHMMTQGVCTCTVTFARCHPPPRFAPLWPTVSRCCTPMSMTSGGPVLGFALRGS